MVHYMLLDPLHAQLHAAQSYYMFHCTPITCSITHLESCTPGQDWAKWYVLVRTSTYQYKTVQVSMRIPNLYILVCTSTYWYVLLRSQVVSRPSQNESEEIR